MHEAIIESARARSIAEANAKARQWAIDQGLRRAGMTTGDYMRALAAYRAHIGRTERPGMKEWARDLVARHAAGLPVPPYNLRLANDALGRPAEPTLVQKADRAPRPDARDRQAGDMEHAA